MTRPSEFTRAALIEAATAVFADKGFEGGSVRLIADKAQVNVAAINYHFGSKEGLYREVLRTTLRAFDAVSLLDPDKLDRMDRNEALRLFVRQQLLPLLKRDELGRYLRIINWEILQRTEIFHEVTTTEKVSLLVVAERLARQYLSVDATAEEVALTTLWLVHQGFVFVRDYEHLARAPFNMRVDEAFVGRLADLLCRLLSSGLSGLADERSPARA